VIFYHATHSSNVGRVLKEGLKPNPRGFIYVGKSPESALAQAYDDPPAPFRNAKKSDLVVLELRGLSRKNLHSQTEKEQWEDDEDLALVRAVPPEKIRVFSGMGYGEQVDLSGPVIKKLWVNVGNKPKER